MQPLYHSYNAHTKKLHALIELHCSYLLIVPMSNLNKESLGPNMQVLNCIHCSRCFLMSCKDF